MTIESIGIIIEALAFYGLQKTKDLNKAEAARLSKQDQGEAYVAESLRLSTARAELEKVSTALNEFQSLHVGLLDKAPAGKS